MPTSLRILTRIAMLGAAAAVLMIVAETPLPFFPDFLKYDPSEIPALVAALTMGPLAGAAVELIKEFIFLASGKATSGLVGVAANFVAGTTLVMAAGWLHRAGHQLRGWLRALTTLVGGTAAMAAVMIPVNALIIFPLYGIPAAERWSGALAVVTFNLVKGGLSGVLGIALYRRLQPWLAHGTLRSQQAA